MLRFLFLILAVVLAASTSHSQGIAVESFSALPNDMTARSLSPVRDANGELSALIKVVTTTTNFDFDGGSLGIVKTEQQPGEWWVYVPSGARTLTIRHPQLGVLRNYAYPIGIKGGSVYEMRLVHGTLETIVKEAEVLSEFIIITSEPSGADVYLNDEPVGKTPFQSEKPEGRYSWRVVRDLYLPEAGVFELNVGSKQKLNLTLKPNFGSIEVLSLPESGAAIAVNGFKLSKRTPTILEEVPSGEQTITLTHEWYETTTQKVNVMAGKTEEVRITMQPNFAELTIEAQNDEEVYINDVRKGKGTYSERMAPGVYRAEVRKESHTTASKQVTLSRGDKETIALSPAPILSALKVLSEPMEAEIYLNGELVGNTPHIVRDLLVGEYEMELRKAGHGTTKRSVIVKENETVEVIVELGNFGGIFISTEPDQAEIYVNDKYIGLSPISFQDIEEGDISIELRKDGFETWRMGLSVVAGKTSEFHKRLVLSRKNYEPEMVFVEGGTFSMGCMDEEGDCDTDEMPIRKISLTSFLIGKFEVTQFQWISVMGGNPSEFYSCNECPVENVSWSDVQVFIDKLNQQTGRNYRLPTEAEWEYAARGGSLSDGKKYAGGNRLNKIGWSLTNGSGRTHPVGQKAPNELGLYDMTGNVSEWCWDWKGAYDPYDLVSPEGPDTGSVKVLRGGSWQSSFWECGLTFRQNGHPDNRQSSRGFRLVLPVD